MITHSTLRPFSIQKKPLRWVNLPLESLLLGVCRLPHNRHFSRHATFLPKSVAWRAWPKLLITSPPSASRLFPDQNRCEHTTTALHWSGFLRSFDAARAHWVRKGSWFSSPKQLICSNVLIISVMAANWALESLISSSYKANAWKIHQKKSNGMILLKVIHGIH